MEDRKPEDSRVLDRIGELVEEEHALERQAATGNALAPAERDRLRRVEVELDQCWDLLRQRRARREFGQDPGDAQVRGADTVERYLQ